LPSFLLGIAGGALLPFQNLYFRQEFALDDAHVGLVLAVTSLVMGLGAAFSGALAHRLGLKRAAWSLRTLAAPAMALMIIPALPFALIGFLMRGFFVASSYPINDALVMQMTPSQQRGAMMSVTSILWSLGWATSAAVSGMTQDAVGFTPAIIASCIAFVLSGLTIYTYRAPSLGIPADAEPQHNKDVA
jgi:MFS family permease